MINNCTDTNTDNNTDTDNNNTLITDEQKDDLMYQLQSINAIQYGDFTLKSGAKSGYYFDLRKIYSYPNILSEITKHIETITGSHKYDLVCGVPISGIPYATSYSLRTSTPMILLRKELKEHGKKQLIEGNYTHGNRVLLIEDVITTGSSILETTSQLLAAGLVVETVAVIIDRRGLDEKKAANSIAIDNNMDIKCILNLDDFIYNFLSNTPKIMFDRKLHNNFSNNLWKLMLMKQTNLCFSMDVFDMSLLEDIGDHICLLKLHLDINDTVNYQPLFELAERKRFCILDDRKYADIGHIVNLQYAKKWLYCIRSCTAHSIFGQSTLDGLRTHLDSKLESCFLIAQSSSTNNLITPEYTSQTYQLGKKNGDLVGGFITQKRIGDDSFLYLTPGVQNGGNNSDQMGQGYRSVEDAIVRDECDIIIVGRGIYNSEDKAAAAKEYCNIGWSSLVKRYSGDT